MINNTKILHFEQEVKEMDKLDEKAELDTRPFLNSYDNDTSVIAESPISYNTGVSMTQRFIKFIPSEKSDWLASKHPNAFILLMFIAKRARRYSGHPDGFEIGWALVGDYKSFGLTHRKYRTALSILSSYKILEIVHSGRKDQKSTIKETIKRTIKGTIVKLCDSDIWDINEEPFNQHIDNQKDKQATNKRQSSDNEQERIRKNNKEKEKEKVFRPNSAEFELAEYFFGLILKIAPSTKKPNFNRWAAEIDKMVRIDSRSPQQIRDLLTWLHTSGPYFWRKNILSPASLRDKWGRLEAERNEPKKMNSQEIRKSLIERFRHGEKYNGAECFVSDEAISFQRGLTHYQVRFKENGFKEQFENMLRKFGINER